MNMAYVLNECQAALRLHGQDDIQSIMVSMNAAYQHLSSLRSWVALRRKATISFASADANNSVLLPADIAGIDAVWEGTSHHNQYLASDQAYAENSSCHSDDRTYRFFYTDAETDALAILPNVVINQSANTFTCDGWSDAYIGEYCQIGNELGFYKLTAAQTISPRWYGPALQGGPTNTIQVRPAGTKRFSVVGYDGKFSANTSVLLYYWVFPTPLYQPSQPILLPDFMPLKLLTVIDILGLKDRKENIADKYRADYENALSKMESLNPEFIPPSIPQNRYGHRLSFTGR